MKEYTINCIKISQILIKSRPKGAIFFGAIFFRFPKTKKNTAPAHCYPCVDTRSFSRPGPRFGERMSCSSIMIILNECESINTQKDNCF